MRRCFCIGLVLAGALVVLSPVSRAGDLDIYCDRWADACDPTFKCPQPEQTGDDGLEFELRSGVPGCEFSDGGDVTVRNNNTDLWVKVNWFGTEIGKNIFMRSQCILGNCGPIRCSSGTGSCKPPTCPGPGPDPQQCDVLQSCDQCGCELPDQTGVVVSPGTQVVSTGCALPGCPEPNCDNDSCTPPTWCTQASPSVDDGGVNFLVTSVSFDGACYYDLHEKLAVNKRDITLTGPPACHPPSGR